MSKKAIVCVTNDLCTDQRVHKTCLALQKSGFEVLELGRLLPNSLALNRPYQTKRSKHFFNKAGLFYAEYNIRLFFFLLFTPVDLIYANDLDTLAAAYLAAKIRGKKLIYDSHEYFTEVPELVNRKHIQSIWLAIEKLIFPNLNRIITVNESIAKLYAEKYKKDITVIRNIPLNYAISNSNLKTKEELKLPNNKHILIIQGTGINIDRGAEEACLAMQYLDNCVLLIIGSGDAIPKLKEISKEFNLNDRIIFKEKMPAEELRQYTMQSDLGLAIDKNTNLNYQLALPNKLFDYIHSNTPILCSPEMPEIKRIVSLYNIGYFIENHNPKQIAQTIRGIFDDRSNYNLCKENLKIAEKELVWETEEQKLLTIFESLKY